MKNAIVASLFALLSASVAVAAPVDAARAKRAAGRWLVARPTAHLTANLSKNVAAVTTATNSVGENAYHVASLEGGGYVVMSSDDESKPVIAFSDSGELTPDHPFTAFLSAWAERKAEAGTVKKSYANAGGTSAASANKFTDEWESLAPAGGEKQVEDGEIVESLSYGLASIPDVRVAPLVKTKWNQGGGIWNIYTPNNRVCGCVATATAQVMKYYEWPKTEIAPFTKSCVVDGATIDKTSMGGYYDWSMMPLSGGEATTEQKEMMSKLCYDVGVAVQMSWASGGSGALGIKPAAALKDNFEYANAIGLVKNLDDTYKGKIIFANLNADCPVILGIEKTGSSSGHEIVADGYGYDENGTDYVHLNFGWGGSKDDSWCNLPANIGTSYNFDNVDEYVYNIFPENTGELIAGRVTGEFGQALSGVRVTAESNGTVYETQTKSTGVYALIVPSSKTYKLQVRRAGYVEAEKSTSVGKSQNTGMTGRNSYYVGTGACGNSWGNDFTLVEDDYEGPECIWTGLANDGKFSSSGNWRGLYAPANHPGSSIVFSNFTGVVTNDIEGLSLPSIQIDSSCGAVEIAGNNFTASAITNASSNAVTVSTPISLAGPPSLSGKIVFAANVALSIPSSAGGAYQLGGDISFVNGAKCTVTLDGGAPVSSGLRAAFAADAISGVSAFVLGNAKANQASQTGLYILNGNTLYLRVSDPALGWIDESAEKAYKTGSWEKFGIYDAETKEFQIRNGNVFVPDAVSTGNVVRIEFEVFISGAARNNDYATGQMDETQLMFRISTNNCFQIYAADESGEKKWFDVEAEGVTPVISTNYSCVATIDYDKGLYSFAINDGGVAKLLKAGAKSQFRIANPSAKKVSKLEFIGSGRVKSILGTDGVEGLPDAFVAGDEVSVSGGGTVILTALEAQYLRSLGDKAAVASRVASMSSEELTAAYLLNLDVMQEGSGYDFSVTRMDVGDSDITITVKLTREKPVSSGDNPVQINGVLALEGAAQLGNGFTRIGSGVSIDFEKFDANGEARVTFSKDGETVFYRPAIVAPQ